MFNCNGSCTLEEIENVESEMYVLTNRSKIRGATGILNQELLEQFDLAHKWKLNKKTKIWEKEKLKDSEEPQYLFIERCIQLA